VAALYRSATVRPAFSPIRLWRQPASPLSKMPVLIWKRRIEACRVAIREQRFVSHLTINS
jgi:hypothetical protein